MTHKQAYLKKRAIYDPLPLDEATKKKYLENPYDCPFCGSSDFELGEWDGEETEAWRKVQCQECEAIWRDFFTLSDMELLRESNKAQSNKETKDWEKRWQKRT